MKNVEDALPAWLGDRRFVIAVVLLGIVYRALWAFPVHKFAADADALNSALRAFHVMDGEWPVFYTTVRLGALESYVHAAFFNLLGVSRAAISLSPLIAGSLLLVVAAFLARAAAGVRAGGVALLVFAFPSASYMFWTYMPNGYSWTMLFGATTVWLSLVVAKEKDPGPAAFFLGLAGGLGWWNSLQTVATLAPAFGWIVLRRRDLLRNSRFLVLAGAGLFVGAFPWIAYNVRHPLATFRQSFARPAGGGTAVLSSAEFLLTYKMPELLATLDTENHLNPPSDVRRGLRVPSLAVQGIALVFAFVLAVRFAVRNGIAGLPPWTLLVGVAVVTIALNLFSEAGQMRGLMVRYVFPLYLLVPVALGLFAATLARRGRLLAALVVAPVLAMNLASAFWPGTAARHRWEEGLSADARLVDFLLRNGVGAVCGDYWLVYPLNFYCRGQIVGVPTRPDSDHYGYGTERLADTPRVWALVLERRDELERWAARTGIPGEISEPAPGYSVFIPDPLWTERFGAHDFLRLLRTAYFAGA